jgi:hypothetical protein
MLGFAGVTAMETSVVDVTVSEVTPETPPDAAVIVVEPAAVVVASPSATIVATPVFDDVQVTEVVRSCVVLSEYVPVALNCWFVPTAMFGFTGVTAMETSVFVVVVEPPPLPPPQPEIAASSNNRMKSLFDFIAGYPLREQAWSIGPSL